MDLESFSPSAYSCALAVGISIRHFLPRGLLHTLSYTFSPLGRADADVGAAVERAVTVSEE